MVVRFQQAPRAGAAGLQGETTMQSSNPVFRKAEGFNGRSTTSPASGMSYPAYGTPTQTRTDPYAPQAPTYGDTAGGRMTIDTVVQKTAMTLGLTILAAAATWVLTPEVSDSSIGSLYVLAMVGALAGFGLAMANSLRRVISPGLVLAYAVVEGIFVGAFSKALEGIFGDGLVVGAVLGTMAAVGGTLAAYKFFNIRVTPTFRKWVVAAMLGFVALSLLDFVLSFFGSSFGFNGFGTMGLISSVIGLGLGVLMLILDFDFVERGVEAGLPERESWRAAFGLTVTIIWIYIELLRILAILRGD
jgi:uncharacterized YccA/Bax inhibitor family protein